MTPEQFINEYIGTPFKFDGRDKSGVDCWGLVVLYYLHVLGMELPDWVVGDKSKHWVTQTLDTESEARCRWLDKPEENAIVFAKRKVAAHHAGVVCKGGVLHATEGSGVVWRSMDLARHEFGSDLKFGVPL